MGDRYDETLRTAHTSQKKKKKKNTKIILNLIRHKCLDFYNRF